MTIGGGSNIQKYEISFINCTLSRNEVGDNGGGVYVSPEVTKVSFSNCILWENVRGRFEVEDNIYIL
jgi:hypothetical protein